MRVTRTLPDTPTFGTFVILKAGHWGIGDTYDAACDDLFDKLDNDPLRTHPEETYLELDVIYDVGLRGIARVGVSREVAEAACDTDGCSSSILIGTTGDWGRKWSDAAIAELSAHFASVTR